jgi:hypothetical protein
MYMADKPKNKKDVHKDRPKPQPTNPSTTNPSSNSITIQYYDGTKWNEVPSNSINNATIIRIIDPSPSQQEVSTSDNDKDIESFQQIYNGTNSQIQVEFSNGQTSIKAGPNENSLNQIGQPFNKKFVSFDWSTSGTRTIDIIDGNVNKNTVYSGILEHVFFSHAVTSTPVIGGGTGGTEGNIGPDGVIQLFPTDKNKPKTWYVDLTKDSFNTEYSSVSMSHNLIPTKKVVKDGHTCFYSEGAEVTYNSTKQKGRTHRINVYGFPNSEFDNKTPYGWESNPGYLYKPGGFKNIEVTIYACVDGRFKEGGHESFAAKLGGREEDEHRSLIEIVYPTASHPDVVANVNYEHFPYEPIKPIKVYISGDKLTPGKWVAVKFIMITMPDQKSNWMACYVDLDPWGPDGKPRNNFSLKAEAVFTGISGYKNIVKTWESQRDYIRIDGFTDVWFTNYSIREIDISTIKPFQMEHMQTRGAFKEVNPDDKEIQTLQDHDLTVEEIQAKP